MFFYFKEGVENLLFKGWTTDSLGGELLMPLNNWCYVRHGNMSLPPVIVKISFTFKQ